MHKFSDAPTHCGAKYIPCSAPAFSSFRFFQLFFLASRFCFISSHPSSSSSSSFTLPTGLTVEVNFPAVRMLKLLPDLDAPSSMAGMYTGLYRDGMPTLLRSEGAMLGAYPGC